MKRTLVVVDMQNDFVTGSLGTPEAVAIVPAVREKIRQYRERGDQIVFTRDTHRDNYLETNEGRHLPVKHCIIRTQGWEIVDGLADDQDRIVNKDTFGWCNWRYFTFGEEIELVGLCTDICVVSNALILKAVFPERKIIVDASCCAGVTPESHRAALLTMKMCQIEVVND